MWLVRFIAWLSGRLRRRRHAKADWYRPRPGLFGWEHEGTWHFRSSLEDTVNDAHTASIVRGNWPANVLVYECDPWSLAKRLVYGPCDTCKICTHKDREGRCMPCYAASKVHGSAEERAYLAAQAAKADTKTPHVRYKDHEQLDLGSMPLDPPTFEDGEEVAT